MLYGVASCKRFRCECFLLWRVLKNPPLLLLGVRFKALVLALSGDFRLYNWLSRLHMKDPAQASLKPGTRLDWASSGSARSWGARQQPMSDNAQAISGKRCRYGLPAGTLPVCPPKSPIVADDH